MKRTSVSEMKAAGTCHIRVVTIWGGYHIRAPLLTAPSTAGATKVAVIE